MKKIDSIPSLPVCCSGGRQRYNDNVVVSNTGLEMKNRTHPCSMYTNNTNAIDTLNNTYETLDRQDNQITSTISLNQQQHRVVHVMNLPARNICISLLKVSKSSHNFYSSPFEKCDSMNDLAPKIPKRK